MARLDEVKKWMTFFGWSLGGGPGAIKKDSAGKTVGKHGDAVWHSDVLSACIRDEKNRQDEMLIDEVITGLRVQSVSECE